MSRFVILRGDHAACLEALARIRAEAVEADALAGNLYALLGGLPDLAELPEEREQEDLDRIVRQSRILRRFAHYVVETIDDQVAKLIAATTPPPSA